MGAFSAAWHHYENNLGTIRHIVYKKSLITLSFARVCRTTHYIKNTF